MFELNHVSGTSNLLNGMMGDTPATDNILGLEPVQNWNPGSGSPTLDVSALNPGALTNLQGTVLPEETVQIALTTGTTDDIDPVTRESSTPVELTGEAGDRLFDAEYYAQINPDLSAAGLNTVPQLFQHFKTHGLGEGRDFSLWTNLEHYAAQNPDLETAGLTLHEQIYQHLQTFGLAEGREFSPWVDLQYYLDNNADLKAAFGEDTAKAFEHLKIFGLEEGRRFSPKLDLNYYLSHYSDLSAEFGDNKKLAFGHLQQFGVAEGRQFLPEIPEAATAESTEVESSAIDEETQEGISIVFETQTTPTTSITTASYVEEETTPSADLETLPDESETDASVSIEVEEETIPDTSDEVEEETIPDTSDEVEEETIPDTFDEVEEDEGTATASDDEVEAEQLSPTVTLSQTLMGLEEEPTPPLDLPENAGGANAKKNPAPKHLKLDATQEEYYQGGTVRLNGWIFDASGANDVERVEFSLHKTGEQWEEIENWTTFNISTKDDRWAYFDYSTFGLEPGKYQIKGFAYDSEGGKSNAAVAHFSVSAEEAITDNPGNTLDTALSILPASEAKTYSDSVSATSSEDYYRFTLGMSNEFIISLDGLSGDANVQLLDSSGSVIQSSTNPSSLVDSISGLIDGGTYYIRVFSVGGASTSYDLSVTVLPTLEDITTGGSEAEASIYEIPIAANSDTGVIPQTNISGSLIKIDEFRADYRFSGIDGNGFATVILDTGIDLDHPFFGSDNNSDGIADRIVYNYDFAYGDANASDVDGHGSNVSSIVASQDGTYTGMAPNSDIIHLKVLGDNGKGDWGWTEQALQWVIANAETYNIASVNMSLGDSGNFNNATSEYGLGDEIAKLKSQGVIVVSASGNDFFPHSSVQGVSYPAADPNSLSIGAVWTGNYGGPHKWLNGAIDYSTGADRITSFSQRHSTLTDIFAPGAYITGAGPYGNLTTMPGTSQASPHIAGIVVLAQQLAVRELGRRLTLDEFRNLVKSTGVTIYDGDDEDDNVTNTGLNFKRVNMLALAEGILSLKSPQGIFNGSDFNGDGKTDFIRQEKDIWASQDDMHMADLYLSNGDGTFAKRSMQPLWN
ncbi:S8 family serine peptidase, partial [Oscillatoria sp. HE19RPO]|uniref:S8 family serine peptidase n=1 Tax=Oscillatoria sp. HE19RPO TaxID=2954806 RepID=UPI0020C2753C